MRYTLAIALFVLSLGTASANVSIRTGNFFIGYTDVIYPGAYEPKLALVYTSQSQFNGVCGWGWGSDYEGYMSVEADGSVLVNESGGGAQNRFSPQNFDLKELDVAVNTIAEAARKAGAMGSGDQLESYKKQLKTNADFRNEEWAKWRAQGKVEARKLKVGTKLVSNRFSFQWITVTEAGYVPTSDTGKVETYDPNGRLMKIQDKNGSYILLTYNKDGKIE